MQRQHLKQRSILLSLQTCVCEPGPLCSTNDANVSCVLNLASRYMFGLPFFFLFLPSPLVSPPLQEHVLTFYEVLNNLTQCIQLSVTAHRWAHINMQYNTDTDPVRAHIQCVCCANGCVVLKGRHGGEWSRGIQLTRATATLSTGENWASQGLVNYMQAHE